MTGSGQSEPNGEFRRLPRQHEQLDALDLYSRAQTGSRHPIRDAGRIEGALKEVRERLLEAADEVGRSRFHWVP